jgi:hypothetical protein
MQSHGPRFAHTDPLLEAIFRVVHGADVKDGEFRRRGAEGIEKAIRALGSQLPDDRLSDVGLHLSDGLLEVIGPGRAEEGRGHRRREAPRGRDQMTRRMGI